MSGVVKNWDTCPCNQADATGHLFEGFISYDFGPVSASWQTYFAGNDYQNDENGKRAYSSYFELSAPFCFATFDWDAKVGLVPWKSGTYEVSGFSVTNLSLCATKAIHITKNLKHDKFYVCFCIIPKIVVLLHTKTYQSCTIRFGKIRSLLSYIQW